MSKDIENRKGNKEGKVGNGRERNKEWEKIKLEKIIRRDKGQN